MAVSLSQSNLTVELEVKEHLWSELPGEIAIEYGHTEVHHELRRHASLGERQEPSSTTASWSIATNLIPTGIPTETSSSKVLNLTYESNPNSKFSFPLGLGPSAPVEIGCILCKTTGSLKVTHGKFAFKNISDINFIGNDFTSPLDYITSGSLDLEMNDFTAHIDLQITPSLSGNLNYSLFPVPIFGFSVSAALDK